MKAEEFDRYLQQRYQREIDWYDNKATANQRRYILMQWMLIVLSALTPVLIELNLQLDVGGPRPLNIATLTGVVVAILTAGLKTFKYQEDWINYRTTCETLRKERHFYDARIADYQAADNPEAVFVDRVEALISRENTMWLSTRKTESEGERARDGDRAGSGAATGGPDETAKS